MFPHMVMSGPGHSPLFMHERNLSPLHIGDDEYPRRPALKGDGTSPSVKLVKNLDISDALSGQMMSG